jgi:uncharacterized protein YfkK (UPF0435 family)
MRHGSSPPAWSITAHFKTVGFALVFRYNGKNGKQQTTSRKRQGGFTMNLETPCKENLVYLINEIKSRLKLVNTALIDPQEYRLEDYAEILALYQMIRRKNDRLTMMEIEGVLEELGQLRRPRG